MLFLSRSLTVVIEGQAKCSGKTTIQYLLAAFLSGLRHTVFVSDVRVAGTILKNDLARYKVVSLKETILPMTSYLHVALNPDFDVPPLSRLDGQTPLKWHESIP